MTEYLAYIDESGDPNFNEHASKIFFVGAVLIEKNEFENLLKKFHEIKNELDIDELKSSKVRSFSRRINILKNLAGLPVRCLSVWVNKSELQGEWFQYKETFYKYIQRLLNHEIYRLFRSTTVTIDRYGSKKYRESLLKYLHEHLQAELFAPSIAVSSAIDEDFIQVADFYGGCLRKVLAGDFSDEEKAQILRYLEPVWDVKIALPDQGKYVNANLIEQDDRYLGYFVLETNRFLESKKNLEPAKRKTLEYLYHTSLVSPDDFVYTDEILDWLTNFDIHYTQEQFRNKVTASLRDEGLIIIGTRKGLKLPTRVTDIIEYMEFSVSQVLPILKRMKKAITTASVHPEVPNLAETLSDEMREILRKVNA